MVQYLSEITLTKEKRKDKVQPWEYNSKRRTSAESLVYYEQLYSTKLAAPQPISFRLLQASLSISLLCLENCARPRVQCIPNEKLEQRLKAGVNLVPLASSCQVSSCVLKVVHRFETHLSLRTSSGLRSCFSLSST
jgi:hypothetical protein